MAPPRKWKRDELQRLLCGIAMMGSNFARVASIVRSRPQYLCRKQAKALAALVLGGCEPENPQAAARVLMAKLHVEPPVPPEFTPLPTTPGTPSPAGAGVIEGVAGAAVAAAANEENYIMVELMPFAAVDDAAVRKKGFNPNRRTRIKGQRTMAELLMHVYEKWDVPIVLLKPDGELLSLDETATAVHANLSTAEDSEDTVQLDYRVIQVDVDDFLNPTPSMLGTVAQAEIASPVTPMLATPAGPSTLTLPSPVQHMESVHRTPALAHVSAPAPVPLLQTPPLPPSTAAIDTVLPIPPLPPAVPQLDAILLPPSLPPIDDQIPTNATQALNVVFGAPPVDSATSVGVSTPPQPPTLPSRKRPSTPRRDTPRKRQRTKLPDIPLMPPPPPSLPPEFPPPLPRRNSASGSVRVQLSKPGSTQVPGVNFEQEDGDGATSGPSFFKAWHDRLDNTEHNPPDASDSRPPAPSRTLDSLRSHDSLAIAANAFDVETGNSRMGTMLPVAHLSMSRDCPSLFRQGVALSQDFGSLWGKPLAEMTPQSQVVPQSNDETPLNRIVEPIDDARDDTAKAVFSRLLKSTRKGAAEKEDDDDAEDPPAETEDEPAKPAQLQPTRSLLAAPALSMNILDDAHNSGAVTTTTFTSSRFNLNSDNALTGYNDDDGSLQLPPSVFTELSRSFSTVKT